MSLLSRLALVCFFFVLTPLAYAEEVTDFSAVYEIEKDGTVLVTETITYDFGELERHGIYRTLDTSHPQAPTAWYKKRSIDIEVWSVKKDDETVPYVVNKKPDEIEIKIGDPDTTITNTQIYTISYTLTGALSYSQTEAEFYYNVTGNKWQVPIGTVTAIIIDSSNTLLSSSSACYVGTINATNSCSKVEPTKSVASFTAQNLPAGSGLTIAQALHRQMLVPQIHEKIALTWLYVVLNLIWVLGLSIWAYRYRTRFRITKPIIAQYEPYEKLLPMYTGVLFDGRLDPKDITAGIVYLAQQDVIKIRQTTEKVLWVFNSTDHEITLLKKMSEVSDDGSRELLTLFFPDAAEPNTVMKLSSLTESDKTKNASTIGALQGVFKDRLATDAFLVQYKILQKVALKILFLVFVVGVLTFFVSFWLALAQVVIGLCIVIYLQDYKLRTIKGNEALHHLKGFKLFLSVTEKERYAFFNAPQKSPELFMQFLPFAIAFGVEEDWEKVFEGISIPTPNWYEGSHSSSFVASSFVHDIGMFSGAVAGASRSANSGSIGSSGGGFSGGGGGGGGGGSW
jgi:uncharacterized membrane protein YgcG